MHTDRFKFRAWDKGWKQMVYPDVIHHNINLGCTIHRAFKTSDGKGYFPIQENLTLMQCTGLKDVEGNLIYEGDILLYKNYIEPVFWASSKNDYDIDGWLCEHFYPTNNQCKIVGNIYETVQK